MQSIKKNLKKYAPITAILLLAATARLIGLGSLPDGVLPDEAYGAYNAYSLLKEGIDSRGYVFPVYFIAWGSGMNVLYSMLAIPFFALFGTDIVIYRLPQALIGIISVYAIYIIGKEIYEKRFGLFLAFVLAINPWHIMNTRFGLESNLAPGIFIIALAFLVVGLKKNRYYLIPSAIFFGATLYAYALSWIVVPLFLGICLLLYYKTIPKKWTTVLAVGLLFLIALPLLLFVGINLELIPEIRTSFFSIPKLPGFRGEELNLVNIFTNVKILAKTILFQYDGAAHTASSLTGAYYYFTTPFMIIGVVLHLISFWKSCVQKSLTDNFSFVFLAWLCSAGIMCALNANITIIHINLIHIPIIFYGAYGIWQTGTLLKNRHFIPACTVFFGISFALFYYDYASNPTTYFFDEKADEVIEAAKEMVEENETITILGYPTIKYSVLLWHEKPSAQDYASNARYTGDPAWEELIAYDNFRYVSTLEEYTEEGVLIASSANKELLMDNGYEIFLVNEKYLLATKVTNNTRKAAVNDL